MAAPLRYVAVLLDSFRTGLANSDCSLDRKRRKVAAWPLTLLLTVWSLWQKILQLSFVRLLMLAPVWPDWVIYWTLGHFSKPVATISLPKSLTFLGDFCKGVKIFNFSSEIILGNLYRHLATFFWSHWTWLVQQILLSWNVKVAVAPTIVAWIFISSLLIGRLHSLSLSLLQ